MKTQLKITTPIIPPETMNMRQRRYLTELTKYVEGRNYITIKEFASLALCSQYSAGQKLRTCRYIKIGQQKQFNLSDVASVMANKEKCDLL